MIRATTPKHVFLFNTNPSEFSRILITYAQGGEIKLEKEKDDLAIREVVNCRTRELEWEVSYRLTQEETKAFLASPTKPVKVQIRILTDSDEALASEQYTVSVKDVLNDEVLT